MVYEEHGCFIQSNSVDGRRTGNRQGALRTKSVHLLCDCPYSMRPLRIEANEAGSVAETSTRRSESNGIAWHRRSQNSHYCADVRVCNRRARRCRDRGRLSWQPATTRTALRPVARLHRARDRHYRSPIGAAGALLFSFFDSVALAVENGTGTVPVEAFMASPISSHFWCSFLRPEAPHHLPSSRSAVQD